VNLTEILRFALVGLLANKVRSLLTLLGVLIGVAAVILLVAVGQGSAVSVEESIESLGSDTIQVLGAGSSFGGAPPGALGGGAESSTDTGTEIQTQNLTLDDAYVLNQSPAATAIKSASPIVTAQVACRLGASSHSTSLTGTWPTYFEASNSPISEGGYFTNADLASSRKVAVIGITVREALFGEGDVIGQQMTCDGVRFTVVGVLKEKGSLGFQDSDDTIIAPLNTVQQNLSGYGDLNSITVQAKDSNSVDQAQSQTTSILAEQHEGAGDWTVLNSATIAAALSESSDVFTVLLGVVAGISLLVGGIGITNIMLVTVTERTREIGIRKAIGASRGTIMVQFLTEATLLSVIGGILGVVVGIVGARFEIAGVVPVLVPYSIALAFGFSVAIGLFFGSFPANRAAGMRPIEALRFE
jgi:putative ABC transport system permease protein